MFLFIILFFFNYGYIFYEESINVFSEELKYDDKRYYFVTVI